MQAEIISHTLSCGMPLLMVENHEVGVATADVWVHTGAADEPDELAGISHFLEHMLFKGTERWGLGKIERAIESVGGVSNAGTSYDFTHYYVTLPTGAIATAIEMLAEMTRGSTLEHEELEKERLVILEEYRRKQDHPAGVLYERLYAELFETGRYHRPVIGTEQSIAAIDRPRMLDYYRRRYSPRNMTLIVAGDVQPPEVIRLAEASFDGFDRPLEAFQQHGAPRYGAAKRVRVTKQTGGELYVAFAFPAPGWNEPDSIMALELAQSILGQGRGARLYQSIKEKQGLCSSISAFHGAQERESLFVVSATCQPEQLEPLRRAVVRELEQFAADPLAPSDINRARRLLASAHRFSLETTGSLTTQLGYHWTVSGGIAHVKDYLENLEATQPQAVRAGAARVFEPASIEDTMVEVAVGPNGADAGR